MTYRLGVDVGGTFTDLALYDVDNDILEFSKTPSTPDNQALGVAIGIREMSDQLGFSTEDIGFFIHGTTVATNSLLERNGARTALIVTEGFRDVLQIARQERPHLYDWRQQRAEPLVPRHLRFEVRERILYTGDVQVPIDVSGLRRIVELLKAAEVDSVAVCFLHSYANPSHERMVGDALLESLSEVSISLSHEILPEFKEYERMSTTCINAFVAPVMGRYLHQLRRAIKDAGIDSGVHIMQSNGGTTTAEAAIEKPVHTILSGPAAGVIGSVALAKATGDLNTISVDMGGTSFDICLSYHGEVRRSQESEIDRLPIKVPMVDIHTLGAGGGSIAWIDPGGALRVGPKSAGADPGPVSYGRGGKEATVTDANLVLGRLSPKRFLGGRMTLDLDRAREIILTRIADPLNLGLEEASEGIIRVVNASMIKGIRVVSVSKGYDPRDFSLVAFGGAGPLHAAELADELNIPRVIVPVAPGVTSAMGLLIADLRHDYVRTVLEDGDKLTPIELTRYYGGMENEAITDMEKEGIVAGEVNLIRLADIRYFGQGYELQVTVASGDLDESHVAQAFDQFHETHRQVYGYESRESPLQVVNLRITSIAGMPSPSLSAASINGSTDPDDAKRETRQVYFGGESISTGIYERTRLIPGDTITGAAIVEQLDSTTVVWPGQTATVDGYRNLILEDVEQ